MRSYLPVGERILVEMDKPDAEIGGLAVPEAHRSPPSSGTVLAVSSACVSPPAIGSRVIFGDCNVVKLPWRRNEPLYGILRWPQEVLATFTEKNVVDEKVDERDAKLRLDAMRARMAAVGIAAIAP